MADQSAESQQPSVLPLPTISNPDPCHIHPLAPQGSALLVAPSNSGKTTLIVNILLRSVFGVNTHYDVIYVFSPTVHADTSWDLIQPAVYHPAKVKCRDGKKRMQATIILVDTFDEGRIARIMDDNMATDKDNRAKILLVIDDFADQFRNTQTLSRLIMRGRHSKVWTWISTQLYRKIPRTIRVNMPFLIFFQVNSNELKTISEELATSSVRSFEDMFRRATNRAYAFLTVNMKKPVSDRYTSNFEPIME